VTRLLVINGDDFGLTSGVNAGMLDAHRDGILTSVSLFANAPATTQAIAMAHATPSLGVGCHLTLVDGTPTLSPAEVPSLVTPEGQFRQTWGAFLRACLTGHVVLEEVRRELTAQIVRLQAAGLTLTHLDAHKHVHTYPPIFRIVAELATAFGVPAVRVPYESPWRGPVPADLREPAIRRQALENLALRLWTWQDTRILAAHRRMPPAFFGKVHTGRVTPAVLARILAALPEGVSELMMHPGYQDAALARVRTRLRREREAEVSLLRSPDARQRILEARVTLVRHDLQPVESLPGGGPRPASPIGRPHSVVRHTSAASRERVIH
jgi:hopanoid biosynthesis associated protein HpnK